MDDEKRTIDGYEVKSTIHIGNKEIIFAENLSKSEPYLVCDCQWDNALGFEVYDEAAVCTDSLEAMSEFTSRVHEQIQHTWDQRKERGVSNEPLTVSDCIPGSKGAHFENQLVVIRPEVMIASSRTADEQLLLAVSGFGCNPEARGQAVFCKNLFTGKTVQWGRSDIAGIILPERIPEWAHQRLQDVSISVEKPVMAIVYMMSLKEAKQNGELEAYRESQRLNRACAISVKNAINDSKTGAHSYNLPSALKAVTAEYGTERVQVVLANTVEYKHYDGRFSHDNKQWAKTIPLPRLTLDNRADFVCEAHPPLLDAFINTAREELREKKPSVLEPMKAKAKKPHAKKTDTVEKTRKDEASL